METRQTLRQHLAPSSRPSRSHALRGNAELSTGTELNARYAFPHYWERDTQSVGTRESEQLALQRLKDMRCDGLILHARNLYDEELIELAQEETPFILLDRKVDGLEDRCVAFEHAEAGKLAVAHLIEHGHRKIGCLAGPRERLTARLRFQGYEQALREHHIELDESLVAEADYDRQGGYQAMTEILEKHPDITAVYSCSEEMCVGAFDLFRERSMTVPGDISMVSFDSVSLCTMLTPAVTTVHFPIKEMA
ncbi:substrate-binding domain-containing protein, partial [Endozoicomonas sp.]|uniref:substrate-binding domain-containing protein n=1 Tax=Endozoicomonas sp. TaxID=1892382 RepID=UPI00383B1855